MSKLNDLLSSIISKLNNAATKTELSQLSAELDDLHGAEYKASIAADVLAILDASADAHVVVDTDNNITLSGVADGEYTLKFNNADGSTTTICTLTVSDGNGEGSGGTDEPDVPAYTNLVPNSKAHTNLSTVFNTTGYMDGAYASSTSPYYGSDATTVCTGAIKAEPDSVFYIKGITMDGSSHVRVGFGRDSSGAIGLYKVGQLSAITSYATIETLGDNYYKLTLNASYISANCPGFEYIYLSGIGTGANLIITDNEPIV